MTRVGRQRQRIPVYSQLSLKLVVYENIHIYFFICISDGVVVGHVSDAIKLNIYIRALRLVIQKKENGKQCSFHIFGG